MLLDKDAFASGQVGSKIWLAGHLEHAVYHYQQLGLFENPLKILLVGGWYGVTNFILQCRQNLKIETIRSIELFSFLFLQQQITNMHTKENIISRHKRKKTIG